MIDQALWHARRENPEAIEAEFYGSKGREWLLRWMPSRAHDNGMFLIFSNGVGIDGDEVRTGNAMVLNPYGEILAETWVAAVDDERRHALDSVAAAGPVRELGQANRPRDGHAHGAFQRHREIQLNRLAKRRSALGHEADGFQVEQETVQLTGGSDDGALTAFLKPD